METTNAAKVKGTVEILEFREANGEWSEQWSTYAVDRFAPENDGWTFRILGATEKEWLPANHVRGFVAASC